MSPNVTGPWNEVRNPAQGCLAQDSLGSPGRGQEVGWDGEQDGPRKEQDRWKRPHGEEGKAHFRDSSTLGASEGTKGLVTHMDPRGKAGICHLFGIPLFKKSTRLG